jgi:ubiquinol-cytochrome c reductase cytochrome b subunit
METEKKGWFEERLGLKGPFGWFLNRKVPRGVGWWYVLGSATLVVFIIQVFTGIFLMLNYSPSPDHAYDSVQYIVNQVTFGGLIRSIHFYAGSAMVILIVLHLLRVFFMAAYKYPREFTWIIGVLLLLLVMGSSFTGYLLPWDQRAYWATNVASGIAGAVPLIGPWVQKILIGGSQIGTLTLTRFFTFHIAVLPVLIAVLIGLHIFMVVKQGISAPPGRMKLEAKTAAERRKVYEKSYENSKIGGEHFFPDTMVRDSIFALIVVVIIMILALAVPHISEAPADPTSTTYNPRPEWYFLFFFEFLKFFPGSLEPVAAVLIPALVIIILIALPFLDRGIGRFWSQRKPALAIGGLVVIALTVLELGGALTAPSRPEGEVNQLVLNGQKVYRDVNCSYCHSINGIGGAIGPDLSNIASQLTKAQLTTYLQNPDLMVPNTLHPKLQFTPDELNALVAYLETLGPPVSYSPQAPQLFADNCSGCHMVNGKGGTEGPDLSREGTLRTLDFLEPFISNPRSVVAGANMPAFQNILTEQQIDDIAAYLLSLKGPSPTPTPSVTTSPAPSATPSATPTPTPSTATTSPSTTPTSTAINASELYSADCASCHGANRQGSYGPAVTTSALANTSIAQITGVITNGAGDMPSFSDQLSPEQINALANFLKNEPP